MCRENRVKPIKPFMGFCVTQYGVLWGFVSRNTRVPHHYCLRLLCFILAVQTYTVYTSCTRVITEHVCVWTEDRNGSFGEVWPCRKIATVRMRLKTKYLRLINVVGLRQYAWDLRRNSWTDYPGNPNACSQITTVRSIRLVPS